MRCTVCLYDGKRASYQDVAVIAGYSVCETHLKEWAKTGHPTVAEWIIERTVPIVIEPTTGAQGPSTAEDYSHKEDLEMDAAERASIEAAEADGTASWLEDVVHPKTNTITVVDEVQAYNAEVDEFLEDISQAVSDAEVEEKIPTQAQTTFLLVYQV